MKETTHKNPHTGWLYLYEVQEQVKYSMLKEIRKIVAYGGGDWKLTREVSGVREIFYIKFGKGFEYLHLCSTYWTITLKNAFNCVPLL